MEGKGIDIFERTLYGIMWLIARAWPSGVLYISYTQMTSEDKVRHSHLCDAASMCSLESKRAPGIVSIYQASRCGRETTE